MRCCSARAATDPLPPRPVVHRARVDRRRAPVVGEARVAAELQQRPHRAGTPVADGAVQRGHATGGECVRIGTRLHEVADRLPLARRIPARRTRTTARRGVQRFTATTVPSPHVGPELDEAARQNGVDGVAADVRADDVARLRAQSGVLGVSTDSRGELESVLPGTTYDTETEGGSHVGHRPEHGHHHLPI